MTETATVADQTLAAPPATATDYLMLMKPKVMSLVVFTGVAGLVAAPGGVDPVLAFASILAIALGSGAAGALNMWYDHDIDAVMARTASRPVPAGRVPKEEALTLGLVGSAMAVCLLAASAGVFAAGLLAFAIVFYAVIYTQWLKRTTDQNIVIGGAAGAFPPTIGWAAATGDAPLDAWLLFAIIFLWTPPHFWALALAVNTDYTRAGVPMLSVTKGPKATRQAVWVYSLLFIPVAVAPVLTGLGGWAYFAASGLGGALFLLLALRILRSRAGEADMSAGDRKTAMALFGFSILYLFLIFAALIAEHGFGLYAPVLSEPLLAGGFR